MKAQFTNHIMHRIALRATAITYAALLFVAMSTTSVIASQWYIPSGAPSGPVVSDQLIQQSPANTYSCSGGISASDIDSYLQCYGSPMAGTGSSFADKGRQYNVDPRFMVAIAGAESSFGKHLCSTYNAFNWFYSGWCTSPFSSWENAIDVVTHGVGQYYLQAGQNTISSFVFNCGSHCYCPNCQDWYNNVRYFYSEQGGNPDTTDLTYNGNSGGSGPPGYTFCANENQRCNFSGTKDVAYGARGQFYYKQNITGGIDCNNAAFGDPISGVGKACYIKDSSSSSCPAVSGEVRLYDSPNCGGNSVVATGTGLWSMANSFNDRAESVAIPGGWSVRLYKDDSTSSPSVCIPSTTTDLHNYTYSDGTSAANSATWLNVYDQGNCPNPGSPDPQQEGPVSISGTLQRGNTAYFTISIKNYGNVATPAIHPYIEGTNTAGQFWRADGAEPGSAVIQPGQTVTFRVQHDLWSAGTWTANGIYLWNNDASTYWKPLPANGQNQQFSFTVLEPPQPPSAPSLSNPGNGSSHTYDYDLMFQWNNASGATEYLIEWWGGPYSTMQPCGWSGSTSCHIGQVVAGHTYYWHVKARNGAGESDWSDQWSFTIQSQPQPPSAPSLSSPGNGSSYAHDHDLTFQWNGVSGATEYLIEWWGGPYSTMQPCGWSNSTSCHIGQVAAGHIYNWHVKARNGAGESGWSEQWSFTIQVQPQPPAAPHDPNPTNGATLSYRTGLDISVQGDGDRFRIHVWGNNYDRWRDWDPSRSLHLDGLTSQVYYWQAEAQNSAGDGPWSDQWSFTIQSQPQPPAAPRDPDPANGAVLSYRTSLDVSVQGDGDRFRIHVWGNNYDRWRDWDPSRSLHLDGLTSQVYYWQAEAQNSAGDGPWSEQWSFTIQTQPTTCYSLTRAHTGSGTDPAASPTNSTGCPTGQYVAGASISLTASPASGWRVGSWSGTSNDSSTATVNSVTMPASNHTVSVNYVSGGSNPLSCSSAPLARDDFSDPNSGWYTSDGAITSWGYYNGEYRILRKEPGYYSWSILPRDFTDYSVAVDARYEGPASGLYGLLFGANRSSGPNYYAFLVNDGAYSLVAIAASASASSLDLREAVVQGRIDQPAMSSPDASWTTLVDWTSTSALNQGATKNRLEVHRRGSQIDLYANGTFLTSVADGRFAANTGVGLLALTYPDAPANIDFRFDNFEVKSCADESNVRAFIRRFYQQCLSREPDQDGWDTWTSALINGSLSGADLAEAFIFSDEFIRRNTSNAEFLTIMYRAFFNREPDAGGYNSWMALLNGGMSRADVLYGFTHSQEFANLCAAYGIRPYMSQRERVEAFVARFYQQCLSRQPDAPGLAAWTDNLLSGAQTGADVARGFIFSTEFTNRNTSNAQFLTIMYRAFFAREPDSGGYNAWLNALNGGMSRADVLNGFTHSQEFANLCRLYGIRPF